MQTSKKHSYSFLQKPQSSYLNISKNAQIKKKCSCTQTDKVGNQQNFYNIFDFSSLNDEFQENYNKALGFLNNCHECMNQMLVANYKECGDSEPDTSNLFRIPKIPNYFSVLLLFLNKANQNHVDINAILKKYNAVQNKNIEVQMKEENRTSECAVIFDMKVQQESSENDMPKIASSCSGMQNFDKVLNSTSNTDTHNSNVEVPEIIVTEANSKSSLSKINDEKLKELIQEQVRKEMLRFINNNKIERIPKASEEERFNKDRTLELPNFSGSNLIRCVKREFSEFLGKIASNDLSKISEEKSVQKKERKLKRPDKNNSEVSKVKIADFCPENLDLMEYSLRKLKEKGVAPSRKHSLNYKMTFSECKLGQQQCSTNEIFKNDSQPSTSSKVEEDTVVSRRCCSSTSASSKNTQRVNEMFQKISRESLNSQKQVSFDKEHTIRNFDYGLNTNYNNDVDHAPDIDLDDNSDVDSDSDSIILDDEEYERKMINTNRQNTVDQNQTLWRTDSFSSQQSAGSSKFKKFHPLQLTEKDLGNVDDKILKTIGIFTTKGCIKPEVIGTIEEKEKMGKNKNKKNKQFRTKRRIDFEVRYQPNDIASNGVSRHYDLNVESSVSEGSFSLKSAVSYSSAGSISKSDLAAN